MIGSNGSAISNAHGITNNPIAPTTNTSRRINPPMHNKVNSMLNIVIVII